MRHAGASAGPDLDNLERPFSAPVTLSDEAKRISTAELRRQKRLWDDAERWLKENR